ncbi:OpgC domain-containing protein [Vibrio sonorensis]|uniref:OpgC domain-containing protein n=1 Tax=Vibrio sonorensis TaxID=1004316 RepID=UPI000B2586CF|nr:OpgC domain-containing protein [Vibrio sonorensis]
MQRNHSVDAIRGTLLLVMTINHFVWITTGWVDIQLLTLQPFGQVGAAEGFIFISGLMVGLIYSGADLTKSKAKLIHRAKQLYLYHIAAILTVLAISLVYMTAISETTGYFHRLFPWLMESKLSALGLSLTLLHKPQYFDILPMYIVFLLGAPWVLQQLNKGRIIAVLLVSVTLWLSSRFIDLSTLLRPFFSEGTLNTGYFSWLAWQMLFVLGMCLGFTSRHKSIDWFKYRSLTILVALIAGTLFVFHRNIFAEYGIHQGTLGQLADKPSLGWLRVFNLLLLVYLFSYLIHLWPNIFAFKPLALLVGTRFKYLPSTTSLSLLWHRLPWAF